MAVETRAANLMRSAPSLAVDAAAAVAAASSDGGPLLEMPPEVKSNVDRARSETVSKLWMATEKMNILYPDNWTRRASEEILWFQGQCQSQWEIEQKYVTKTTSLNICIQLIALTLLFICSLCDTASFSPAN
jgi:hypothetical protein